ncbi:MAG: hypothetical protein COA47_10275 [Robiginitomaculum sp.]|nr:MAG: hypothetical protein COA47_10275 [Robiginitomaculum sp.]
MSKPLISLLAAPAADEPVIDTGFVRDGIRTKVRTALHLGISLEVITARIEHEFTVGYNLKALVAHFYEREVAHDRIGASEESGV